MPEFARRDSDASALPGKAAPRSVSGELRIGDPDDVYEREADRVADEVISGGPAKFHWSLLRAGDTPLQRTCPCGGSEQQGECDQCQQHERERALQRKPGGAATPGIAPPIVRDVLKSSGKPLDPATRAYFEPRFGHDFGSVRLHVGADAAASANAVGARAYTVGQHVVFAESEYSPRSSAGLKLMSHELAHVVQQAAGRPLSVQRQCTQAICPPVAVPIGSYPPTPQQAEECLQEQYEITHPSSKPGISLGFNQGWIQLLGGSLPERQALTCLRGGTTAKAGPHFTAKHGMYAAQPDIWDFANRTMYEVTTPGQATFKSGTTGKLAAQIALANAITGTPECGGLMFSPGGWAPSPSPCCLLPSGLYISTVNVGGVLIYTVLKDMTKEVTLAVMLATMAAILKSSGGSAAARQAVGAAAGKKLIPVYAVATLVATAILASSGKAEAKAGPGDEEPIVQVFKLLDQKGTPVPKEIQDAIQSDPELKAKLDAALKKGGDPSALQKELNEKILKIIADNPEQFTKEDLEKILTMTGTAGKALPGGDVTVDKVRKMLDQKGGSGGSGSQGGSGQGQKNAPTQAEHPDVPPPQPPAPQKEKPAEGKPPVGTTASPASAGVDRDKYPGLNGESIAKISAAKAPVRALWDAVTGPGKGPKITDTLTEQFFQVVPADLSQEEAEELIQHLAPADKDSGEQVLATLKKAIEQLKKKKAQQAAVAAEAAVTKIEPSKPAKTDAKTQQDPEEINKLAELARSGDFSKIAPGETYLNWTPKKGDHVSKGSTINATLKGITADGKRAAGRVTGLIKARDGQKLTIVIIASTPIVLADGTVLLQPGKLTGKTSEYVLEGK